MNFIQKKIEDFKLFIDLLKNEYNLNYEKGKTKRLKEEEDKI